MMRLALAIALLVPACIDDGVTLGETTQAMAVCANGPTTFGIDVSRFQGDIDWNLVAGAGVKFAYIQISRSLTDIDLKFPYNWPQAKANGILRGAYQRFRPGMSVEGQAKLFVDTLAPVFEKGDLPPMLDVEDADGLTATQIASAVTEWMEYVEPRIGLRPIIYTGYYFWRDSVGNADFTQHLLWVPNYSAACPLVPGHWTRWTLHQYSSTAMIPGITANTVDVNKFNGTLDELVGLAGTDDAVVDDGSVDVDGKPDGEDGDADTETAPGGCSTSHGGGSLIVVALALWFIARKSRGRFASKRARNSSTGTKASSMATRGATASFASSSK
jgi:lysozyme